MDEDIEHLLRHERERPSMTPARVERMWRAVSQELAVLQASPGGVAGRHTPASGSSAQPTGPLVAPVPTGPAPMPTASWLGRSAAMVQGHLPWMALTLGLGSIGGLVAGGQLSRAVRHTASAHTEAARVPELGAPAPEPAPEPSGTPILQAAPSPMVAPPPAMIATNRPDHGRRRENTLAGERAMLERAESALRRGDWSAALHETETYAQRFPRGELVEENLYLAMRACLAGGDQAGARMRLEELRRRFPHSALVQPKE
jgi:hypothetical protein